MSIIDIVDKLYKLLETTEDGVIVMEGWYDENINNTHITFLLEQDIEKNHADDINASEEVMIQVDIWSKNSKESRELKKKVKKILKDNNFLYETGQDFYELESKLFHKAMRFNYTIDN